jgi:hypothetical protein
VNYKHRRRQRFRDCPPRGRSLSATRYAAGHYQEAHPRCAWRATRRHRSSFFLFRHHRRSDPGSAVSIVVGSTWTCITECRCSWWARWQLAGVPARKQVPFGVPPTLARGSGHDRRIPLARSSSARLWRGRGVRAATRRSVPPRRSETAGATASNLGDLFAPRLYPDGGRLCGIP